MNVGKSAGISGVIDFPGISGAKIQGRINRWQEREQGTTKPRRGRGGGIYRTVRWLMSSGTFALSGRVRGDGQPAPSSFKGQTGTVTITIDTGKTIAYPVIVTEVGFSYDEKTQDRADIVVSCEITGDATYTGFANVPSATDPSKSDQIQWDGSSKTIDPQGLQSTCTRLIDIWGTLTDSDAAEQTKLLAVIAAAAPPITTPHDAKLRSSTFVRDALDGGTITEIWGLTTTAEDVENASTYTKNDPGKIATGGVIAKINNSDPTLPTISGQTVVSRGITITEINDSNTLYKKEFGQLSTQDDITYPDTHKDLDVSDLKSTGISTSIFANGGSAASAPDWSTDGIQPVKHTEIRINRDEWKAVDVYDKDTSKQKWEQEHSSETTDTNQLASEAESGAVDDSTPPAPVNTNLVKRFQKILNITHDHVGYVDVYGLRTTTEDREFPGTHAKIDKAGLDSEGIDTNVYDSGGSVPADASSPDASLQAVATEITRINQVRSEKVTLFKVNKSDEQWLYDHTKRETDPSNLKNLTVLGAIYTTGSEPSAPGASGLVLNHKSYVTLASPTTSNKSAVLWFYGETTSADDEIFPKTKLEVDSTGLDSSALTGAIFTTGSPPSDPSAPFSGVKLIGHIDSPLTNASASNQSIRLYKWGTRDSGEERGFQRRHVEIDGNHIADNAITYAIWNTGDSAPDPADHLPDVIDGVTANVKLITFDDKPLTEISDTTYLRWFLWGPKDSKDEAILERYDTETDASTLALASRGFRGYLDGDTPATTITDANSVTLKKIRDIVKPLTLALGTNRTLTVREFGLATAQDKLEAEKVLTFIDRNGSSATSIADKAVRTKLWLASGSAPTAPDSVPSNNVKLIGFDDVTVPDNPLLKLRVFMYGAASSDDEEVLKHYETTTDVSNLGSTAIRACFDGSSNPSTVTDANSQTLVAIRSIVHPMSFGLGTNRTLTITEYSLVTDQTKIEQGSSEAVADPLAVYRSKVSTIVSHGGDDNKTVALAAAAANASNAEFVSARFKRIPTSATKGLLTLTFTGEDNKIHSEQVSSQLYPYRGKPTVGFDDVTAFGVATSYVKAIIPGPTIVLGGYDSARVDYTYWERKKTRFLVRKRYITTTARQPDAFRFHAQRGKVNASTFLRFTGKTVKFIGAKQIYNATTNDNHLVVEDLEFEEDSQFHMGDQNLPLPGQRYKFFTSSVFIASSGYIDPRIFFGVSSTLCDLYWPSTTDFSVFNITG